MPVPYKTTGAGKRKRTILVKRLEIVVLICLLWIFFIFAGRALSKIAIIQISELTNTKITARSVAFNLNGSVVIKDLKIRPYQNSQYDDFIVKAEKVSARFEIGSLILRKPQLKKITIKNFIFNVQQNTDTGQWNLASVKIRGHKDNNGKIPSIYLKGGTFQYSKVSNGSTKTIAAIPIEAQFKPDSEIAERHSFNIASAPKTGHGKSILSGYWQSGKFKISGSIASDLPVFEKTWSIDALEAELNYDKNNEYSLKLKTKELSFSNSLTQQTLTAADFSFLKQFGPFNTLQIVFDKYNPAGLVDTEFYAAGNLNHLSKSTLSGKITCKNVSACYRWFPYELTHLTGQIDLTEKNVSLNNLKGKHKEVDVALNSTISDFGPERKYQFRLTSGNMLLNNDLYEALSEKQKKLWSEFSPSGMAKIDYQLSRQSQMDIKEVLEVRLLNSQAVYKNFSYPLKNLTGTLLFDGENIIVSDITSLVNERKITLNGKATGIETGPLKYDISVDAKNIPLDSTLRNILPDKQLENQFDIINKYGQGVISLTGRLWGTEQFDKPDYNLLIHTENLELKDDLIAMLPEQSKAIISRLQPKGRVNYNLELNKDESNEINYKIIVNLLDNSINFEPFPYPIRNIKGSIVIAKNSIELQNVTAAAAGNIQLSSDSSQIKINGKISTIDNTFGSGQFSIYANDILLDERINIALPEKIRPYYLNLSPTGRFDLDFENIKIFNSDDGEKYIDFEGTTRLKSCNFNVYPDISSLNAVLKTNGLYKTGYGLVQGQASIDAENVNITGKAITDLKADLYYDENHDNWLTNNLIAKCYDGIITGRFELKKSAEKILKYSLQTGFYNIDLKQFLSSNYNNHLTPETKSAESPYSNYSSGKMSGSLSLAGQFSNNYLPIGRCRIQIIDMKFGKLSPMAKLLQSLKLTEPKDSAFNQMLVDSYIQHNKLTLEQVDIAGNALAFNGSGWINLSEQNINLSLTARGERLANTRPSAFQYLTESLGHAVVRVDVTGNFNNPDIKTTPMPIFKEAAGLLGTKAEKTKKTK